MMSEKATNPSELKQRAVPLANPEAAFANNIHAAMLEADEPLPRTQTTVPGAAAAPAAKPAAVKQPAPKQPEPEVVFSAFTPAAKLGELPQLEPISAQAIPAEFADFEAFAAAVEAGSADTVPPVQTAGPAAATAAKSVAAAAASAAAKPAAAKSAPQSSAVKPAAAPVKPTASVKPAAPAAAPVKPTSSVKPDAAKRPEAETDKPASVRGDLPQVKPTSAQAVPAGSGQPESASAVGRTVATAGQTAAAADDFDSSEWMAVAPVAEPSKAVAAFAAAVAHAAEEAKHSEPKHSERGREPEAKQAEAAADVAFKQPAATASETAAAATDEWMAVASVSGGAPAAAAFATEAAVAHAAEEAAKRMEQKRLEKHRQLEAKRAKAAKAEASVEAAAVRVGQTAARPEAAPAAAVTQESRQPETPLAAKAAGSEVKPALVPKQPETPAEIGIADLAFSQPEAAEAEAVEIPVPEIGVPDLVPESELPAAAAAVELAEPSVAQPETDAMEFVAVADTDLPPLAAAELAVEEPRQPETFAVEARAAEIGIADLAFAQPEAAEAEAVEIPVPEIGVPDLVLESELPAAAAAVELVEPSVAQPETDAMDLAPAAELSAAETKSPEPEALLAAAAPAALAAGLNSWADQSETAAAEPAAEVDVAELLKLPEWTEELPGTVPAADDWVAVASVPEVEASDYSFAADDRLQPAMGGAAVAAACGMQPETTEPRYVRELPRNVLRTRQHYAEFMGGEAYRQAVSFNSRMLALHPETLNQAADQFVSTRTEMRFSSLADPLLVRTVYGRLYADVLDIAPKYLDRVFAIRELVPEQFGEAHDEDTVLEAAARCADINRFLNEKYGGNWFKEGLENGFVPYTAHRFFLSSTPEGFTWLMQRFHEALAANPNVRKAELADPEVLCFSYDTFETCRFDGVAADEAAAGHAGEVFSDTQRQQLTDVQGRIYVFGGTAAQLLAVLPDHAEYACRVAADGCSLLFRGSLKQGYTLSDFVSIHILAPLFAATLPENLKCSLISTARLGADCYAKHDIGIIDPAAKLAAGQAVWMVTSADGLLFRAVADLYAHLRDA